MGTTRTYRLKALTDIWTGSVRLEEKNDQLQERIVPDRLIATGLLGSIRWWFEVVVRGIGGSACDPTADGNRCPDSRKAPNEGHHCVVCELFGCTGWARKFRFQVLDQNGNVKQDQIKKGQTFQLSFTPLRPIATKEWALLDLTIRLIADYGAIGGKTVYKPSDDPNRQNLAHHQDYGLIKIRESPNIDNQSAGELKAYVASGDWRRPRHANTSWASLECFWCVKNRYLARQNVSQSTFNRVIGRPEPKPQASKNDSWIAGRRAGPGGGPESKKVFSFKAPESARRTFGFVQSLEQLSAMPQRLRDNAWPDLRDDEFVAGGGILRRLLGDGGRQ